MEIGDRVVLPDWYKLTFRQRRVCVVVNESDKYYLLAACLANGTASKDRKTHVYWHKENANELIPYPWPNAPERFKANV